MLSRIDAGAAWLSPGRMGTHIDMFHMYRKRDQAQSIFDAVGRRAQLVLFA
jgi:hypothetical protein